MAAWSISFVLFFFGGGRSVHFFKLFHCDIIPELKNLSTLLWERKNIQPEN